MPLNIISEILWWYMYTRSNYSKTWIPRCSILSFKDLIYLLKSLLALLNRQTLYNSKLLSRLLPL